MEDRRGDAGAGQLQQAAAPKNGTGPTGSLRVVMRFSHLRVSFSCLWGWDLQRVDGAETGGEGRTGRSAIALLPWRQLRSASAAEAESMAALAPKVLR